MDDFTCNSGLVLQSFNNVEECCVVQRKVDESSCGDIVRASSLVESKDTRQGKVKNSQLLSAGDKLYLHVVYR